LILDWNRSFYSQIN